MRKKENFKKKAEEKEKEEILQTQEKIAELRSEMALKSKDTLIAEKFVYENIIEENAYYSNLTRLAISVSYLTIFLNIISFIAKVFNSTEILTDLLLMALYLILLAAAILLDCFDRNNSSRRKRSNECRLKIQIIDEILSEMN